MILFLFAVIASNLFNAQLSFDDCKKRNFEPEACLIQKSLYELSEKAK